MRHLLCLLGLSACWAVASSTSARASLVLSGPDANAGSYSTSSLAGVATAQDTVSSGGVTGVSLWGLLGGAASSSSTSPIYGAMTTSTPAGDNGKNAILQYYLLATSSSGAQSVVSLGEIDPTFGGTAASPAFIAYGATGGGLLASPELIVPGGTGRDLTDVTSLQLLAAPPAPNRAGGTSTSVQLSGNVTDPGSYTLSALQTDFTPVTETVSGDSYTGVPLWTFVNPDDSNITNQIVVTQGTDGYEVVLSLAELDPALGGNPENLLPYADTGTDFPGDGVARTIFPDDNKHGRWDSNLDSVQVLTVSEPSSMILIASAMAILALLRLRPRHST